MTKEFFAQLRPMGKPIERERIPQLLSQPWDMARGLAYVHIIFEQKNKIWFVLNGPDKKYQRGPDWGVPTEEALPEEKIFFESTVISKIGAVQRLMMQEMNQTNPENYSIAEQPIWVSKDPHGHYHFVFQGSFEVFPGVFSDITEKPIDPAGEVKRTKLVDIFKEIEEKTEEGKTVLYLDGYHVRIGHIGSLKLIPLFKN